MSKSKKIDKKKNGAQTVQHYLIHTKDTQKSLYMHEVILTGKSEKTNCGVCGIRASAHINIFAGT
ncbi:MAG TPA: hypothetical protein VFM02_00660 [Candidatus Paceibacterota bacterium]|nr:hypothetical protein [Candidatus Paceibacterota bacterium]